MSTVARQVFPVADLTEDKLAGLFLRYGVGTIFCPNAAVELRVRRISDSRGSPLYWLMKVSQDENLAADEWAVVTGGPSELAVLALIAREGASRCGYAPGAGDAREWPTSRCDCKSVVVAAQLGCDEHTGCVELRQAYRVLAIGAGMPYS